MVAAKSKKKSTKSATPKVKKITSSKQEQEEDILQAIEAISDESDEDEGQAIENASDSDADGDEEQWDQDALALRQMISDGKFNDLLKKHDEKKKNSKKDSSSDDDVEEEELESDDGSEKDYDEDQNDNDAEEDSESSDDEDEEEEQQKSQVQDTRATAMAAAIQSSDRHLPFAESFTVVPPTPLPFGPPKTSVAVGVDDDEEEAVDIHDDLKREVAFYDNALEAVNIARGECEKAGIPFTRPDDFFAEMIKTDGKFKRYCLHEFQWYEVQCIMMILIFVPSCQLCNIRSHGQNQRSSYL